MNLCECKGFQSTLQLQSSTFAVMVSNVVTCKMELITLKSTNMKPLSLITIRKKVIKQHFVVILLIALAVLHGGFNLGA